MLRADLKIQVEHIISEISRIRPGHSVVHGDIVNFIILDGTIVEIFDEKTEDIREEILEPLSDEDIVEVLEWAVENDKIVYDI
jgi:Mg/Co/Ni transporter MgtE